MEKREGNQRLSYVPGFRAEKGSEIKGLAPSLSRG